MIRRRLRSRLLDRTQARAEPLGASRRSNPTLVLAPHPDDETLGCGGLVSLLVEHGTPVSIVFMTDGAGSHPDADVSELAATRRREAGAAAEILGVPADRLHFLGHPDGGLAGHEARATEQIVDLLDRLAPTQVVAPHPFEPNADHSATFRILEAAVRRRATPIDALLYAVWFWDQWPWTNPLSAPRPRHARREMLRAAWRGRLGLGVARRLPVVVDISGVLDRKRAALAAHASQTARPADRPDWLTLADVADGDWLDLLLRPCETYAAVRLPDATVP